MVLKLFLFSEKYFMVKIFVFFEHTYLCFFSNLGHFLEINYFLTQYYNGKEKKDLHFRYTTHITRTSRVWQDIWGADLFSTSYSRKMASGSLFFTKSDPILQQEGKKRSALLLYHTYHKNLTSVASYLVCRSF